MPTFTYSDIHKAIYRAGRTNGNNTIIYTKSNDIDLGNVTYKSLENRKILIDYFNIHVKNNEPITKIRIIDYNNTTEIIFSGITNESLMSLSGKYSDYGITCNYSNYIINKLTPEFLKEKIRSEKILNILHAS